MSDYIKREDAIEAFDPQQRRDWYTPWIVEELKDLPSADVAPVRHGHWIKISPAGIYECSECGKNVMTSDIEAYEYCQGCGARMDGEKCESIFSRMYCIQTAV
jgi:hypothetical protein